MKCSQKESDEFYIFFHTGRREYEVLLQALKDKIWKEPSEYQQGRDCHIFGIIPSAGHETQYIQTTADTQSHAQK